MTSRFSLPIAALLAVAWISPAGATSIAPLTTDQMTDASDLIVRGTVMNVRTEVMNGYVHTLADLEVHKVYKGTTTETTLTLDSLGGEYQGLVINVDGVARYSVGEDVVAFLSEFTTRHTWGTVGMSLGKYTVRQNPTDGSDMVVRFTVPYTQVYDARFIPNPPAPERVSLTTLESAVNARLSLGWDGKAIPGVSNDHLRAINHIQPGVR